MLLDPAALQPRDGGGRQARSVLAEQCGQRFLEVAGRDPLQIVDRDQHLQALGAPRIGRQDRGREANASSIVGTDLSVAHTRLAHGNRTDAGHDLALGQVAMAHHALEPVLGLEIRMLGEQLGHLGLDGLA